ncbi:MAG: hypothetical protein FWF81_06940 [Defluviitaleaceae bacterium]|nr:hypothetical protein [Defluviitaleaceae bacterium]
MTFANFALTNDLTVSNMHLGRWTESVEIRRAEVNRGLLIGIHEPHNIYIFNAIPHEMLDTSGLYFYIIDDVVVGLPRELENVADMQGADKIIKHIHDHS